MASGPTSARDFRTPSQKPFHRKLNNELGIDPPSDVDDPRYLFSMPFVVFIDGIADVLFPPNVVKSIQGIDHEIVASEASIDRYIMFRAVWQPNWGKDVHRALRLFAKVVESKFGKTFLLLDSAQKIEALTMLENRKFATKDWDSDVDQRRAFNQIREAISEGFFSEPGYGGNRAGLGWYYSNFMMIED